LWNINEKQNRLRKSKLYNDGNSGTVLPIKIALDHIQAHPDVVL